MVVSIIFLKTISGFYYVEVLHLSKYVYSLNDVLRSGFDNNSDF